MAGPTLTEEFQHIVEAYRFAGMPWPASSRQIASWAITESLWMPRHNTLVDQCAEQLSRAMRDEFIHDPQGRSVRAKHAARVEVNGEQLVLWADIRTADRRHMEIAFQQRRQQIVGDCHQLKIDTDSYNDNGNIGMPLQLIFDFTEDLAELEALAHAIH